MFVAGNHRGRYGLVRADQHGRVLTLKGLVNVAVWVDQQRNGTPILTRVWRSSIVASPVGACPPVIVKRRTMIDTSAVDFDLMEEMAVITTEIQRLTLSLSQLVSQHKTTK